MTDDTRAFGARMTDGIRPMPPQAASCEPAGRAVIRHGSLDAPTVSDEGAVIYLRGAVPSADQLV